MVDDVWKGASMPKGFTLGERTAPGQVRFQNVPSFMTKSLGDKITQKTKKQLMLPMLAAKKEGSLRRPKLAVPPLPFDFSRALLAPQ